MNKFKKDLQVKQEYKEKYMLNKINTIIEKEMQNVNNSNFSIDEKLAQQTVLFRLHKIIDNYDDLEMTLQNYFIEKTNKEKFNGR